MGSRKENEASENSSAYAYGVNIYPEEYGNADATAVVDVEGSVEASASSDDAIAFAVGIRETSSNGGFTEVNVGDTAAFAQGGNKTEAVGVNVQIYDKGDRRQHQDVRGRVRERLVL